MKQGKQGKQQPPKESPIKQALLGLYGIVGVSISTFGGFKLPFAESNAKEYWRHALAGIVLILALISGIISLALYLFDANYFKSQMVDYVKTHNQRDLTLDGDIKVTFFPKLALKAEKMSLSQRNSSKNFASIEKANFYVAWGPLFLKQLQIEHVDLDGVHANIVRFKNGSTNLDDLFTRDGSLTDVKFDIDSIKLKNSSINITNEPTGILYALRDMEIKTGRLTDSTPGNFYATFRLESTKPRIDTKVKLNSHLLFELKTNHYEFANFEIELEGESMGITSLSMLLQGTLNSYPTTSQLTIDKFVANIKGKIDNRKLDAKIDIPKLQRDKNKITATTLNLNANLLQEDENLTATLDLSAFEILDKKFHADNVNINFDIFKAGRTLQGKLNTPMNIDFDTLQVQLTNITSNFSVTHPLLSSKLNATLNGSMLTNFNEQKLKLDFNAKIDDTKLGGNAGFHDFSNPAYVFDIAANKLDLDRYLVSDWSKRFQDNALPFDFSGIKTLSLNGKLRSGEFKFAKLKTTNLTAEILVDQSTLKLEPFNTRLYGGSSQGSFSITASNNPKITFQQKLNGVQINALLADFYANEPKLLGKGTVIADLNSTGNSMGELRKTVSGSINLSMNAGSVAGINLTESFIADKAKIGIKESEHNYASKFTDATAFSEFKSSFTINEGKASNNDFLLRSMQATSKGEGEISLETGQLDYRINTIVSPNLKRGNNNELYELKGINIPMRITGKFTAPAFIMEYGNASGGFLTKPVKSKTAIPVEPSTVKRKPVKK